MTALLDGQDPAAVTLAAARLAAGELVAFPTETVYGLGARADDDSAVARIFLAKGRPADHPLIVHVANSNDAHAFTHRMPASAQLLIDAFWPGPLTVIVPRAPGMGQAAAGGQDSIGLRCPEHPVALALLVAARRLGVAGVAGPSANRFGKVSPTLAAHVIEEFGTLVNMSVTVLDGGPCRVGIESTIVDCSRAHPVLLRPGVLTHAAIEAVLGEPLREADAQAPRAPGTLEAHYAPRAKLRLMPTHMLHNALQMPGDQPLKLAVYSRTMPLSGASGSQHRRMPADPEQAAQELFAVIRELDSEGAELIWVEDLPPGPEWDGVRDRLQRAAAS